MKIKTALLMALILTLLPAAGALAAEQPADPAAETQDVSAEEIVADSESEIEETGEAFEYEDIFPDWNEDAPALNALIDYVEGVTDESSPDFIPVADRIAVFDMDGTLCGELFPTYLEYYLLAWRILKDPSINPDAEMLEVGRTIRDCALDASFPEDMALQHAVQAARAYAGLTLDEFSDYVTEILLRDVDGFEGMTYGEAFYPPMVEVIDYLQENDFKVYVISGSDRFICRTLCEGTIDVPYEQIIGMDVYLKATGQGDTVGMDYVYTSDDTLIRTDRLMIKNLKMNKVLQIMKEIGHQPVLSFGNSSGDVSMHNYTIFDNPYKSAAFMLVADDADRDYANLEKTLPLLDKWADAGYHVISMKNDFLNIYPEGVKKTGSFHWLEELAEDRVPADTMEYGMDVHTVTEEDEVAEAYTERMAEADGAQEETTEPSTEADSAQEETTESSAEADGAQENAAESSAEADGAK